MIETIRSGTLARRLALAATLTLAAVVAGWVASYFVLDILENLRNASQAGDKRDVLARFLEVYAGSGLAILVAAALARGAEALEPGAPLARGSRTAASTMAWISLVAAIGYVVLTLTGGDFRSLAPSVVFLGLRLIGLSLAAAALAGGAAMDDVEAQLDAEDAAEDAAEEDATPPLLVSNEPPAAPYRAWDAPTRTPNPPAPPAAPEAPVYPSDPESTMPRPSEDSDPPAPPPPSYG